MKTYTTKCKACGQKEEILYGQGETRQDARDRLERNCERVPKLCHFGPERRPDPATNDSSWDRLSKPYQSNRR